MNEIAGDVKGNNMCAGGPGGCVRHDDQCGEKMVCLWRVAISDERERCAKVALTALRADYAKKTGYTRGPSEAEVFIASAIRSGESP